MTSSSSLYGSVTTQNVSSTNSTSLYGEAGTPIPDSSGNVVVRGDLYVLSGNILTTANTGNIFTTNATTINLGSAATSVNIGSGTGTTTINNALTVGGNVTAPGADFGNITIAVADDQTITTTSGELRLSSTSNSIKLVGTTSMYTDNTSTFNLLNQPTTVGAFLGATSLNFGAVTGTTNVNNNLLVEGTGTFTGDITTTGATAGNIQIGITDNQTIDTTTGELRLSSTSNSIRLPSITSITTDTTGSFGFLNQPTTVNAFLAATTLNLGATTGTTDINNSLLVEGDFTLTGNNINLAQGTLIGYSENNNRLNRPVIQSTTGLTSGLRIIAPSTASNATSTMSVSDSSDSSNTTFLALQSVNSATDPLRIFTGKYTAGVFGASGDSIAIRDGSTTYATINPAGPTIGTDLTTKTYVDSIVGSVPTYDTNVVPATGGVDLQLRELNPPSITIVGTTTFLGGTNITVSETSSNVITIDGTDLNTTYTIDATSTTGGANFNLTGSDASVDTIKFASAGATTVSRTDANTIQISSTDTNTTYDFNATSTTGGANLNLVGSDSTTDTVKLTNGGHITATYTSGTEVTLGSDATDANTVSTIVARDSSGNFSAGTISLAGNLVATKGVYAKGIMDATYTDGIVVDYATGNGRISVGSADTLSFYNGGVASTLLGQFSTTGSLAITNDLDVKGGDITNSTGALQIATTSNGALTLAPNGTGNVAVSLANGQNLTNTRNYVLGAIRNATTASTGDIWAINATGNVSPYRGISLDNSADTTRGPGEVIRSFSGGAVNGNATRGRVIFEKARGTSASPTAVQAGDLLGSIDGTGYTSTGWVNDNISAVVPGTALFAATENWVSNTNLGTALSVTLAPSATTISSSANLINTFTTQPEIAMFRGDRMSIGQAKTASFTATGCSTSGTTLTIGTLASGTIAVGNVIQLAGSAINGLYIVANISGSGSGSTWTLNQSPGTLASLSITGNAGFIGGSTAGTTVDALQSLRLLKNTIAGSGGTTQITTSAAAATLGLTGDSTNFSTAAGTNYASLSAGGNTFTNTALTNVIRQGTTNTTIPAFLLRYSRTDTTGSNDGDGVDFRLGTGGTSTTNNIARFDAQYRTTGFHQVGISVSTDNFAADTDTIYRGQADKTVIRATPTGTTGTASDIVTVESTKVTMAVPVAFPVYTKAQAAAVTGAVGWQICISDSAQGANPNGMMAFWDTTNARWSYIHDNSAV